MKRPLYSFPPFFLSNEFGKAIVLLKFPTLMFFLCWMFSGCNVGNSIRHIAKFICCKILSISTNIPVVPSLSVVSFICFWRIGYCSLVKRPTPNVNCAQNINTLSYQNARCIITPEVIFVFIDEHFTGLYRKLAAQQVFPHGRIRWKRICFFLSC